MNPFKKSKSPNWGFFNDKGSSINIQKDTAIASMVSNDKNAEPYPKIKFSSAKLSLHFQSGYESLVPWE